MRSTLTIIGLCGLVVALFATTLYAQEDSRDRDRDVIDETSPPTADRDREYHRDGGEVAEGVFEGMPPAQYRPGGNPQYRPPVSMWQLGVYTANTSTGVRITKVVAGSAAWSAGLEQWDKIIAVEGYQVGTVGERLFYLGTEIQRRAKSDGVINLLIQNWRTNELVAVKVRLQRSRP